MKVVAFVPIKLNSQRLPHKNILPIGGKPLCWHICNTLLHVEEIEKVYVYCSDETVVKYLPEGVELKLRPKELDGDNVKGFQIYESFIKEVDSDVYILAHTTSPFIKKDSISTSVKNILSGQYDSAFSAERIQTFAWYKGNPINYDINDVPRTQDMEPIFVETSAFYMFKKEIFTEHHRRIGYNPYIYEIHGIESVDIDEREDYDNACMLYEISGSED